MRLIFFTLSLILGTSLAGCQNVGIASGKANTPTGGVAIRMYVSDEASSHSLYVLNPSGNIQHGGGFDALNGKTTWSGSLSHQELDELQQLLTDHGWFERTPVADNPNDLRKHRINFAWPGGGWRFETKGGGSDIDPIRDFLRRMAGKRHQNIIDRLPEAGDLD